MSEYKVNVYDDNGNVVARVNYNQVLDFWDGRNWSSGSLGNHLGITRLRKSGRFVLIYGTDFQGRKDYAEVVSDREAYNEIARTGNTELLEKYPDLRKFEEENIETEEV